jgi:hypothetical protein
MLFILAVISLPVMAQGEPSSPTPTTTPATAPTTLPPSQQATAPGPIKSMSEIIFGNAGAILAGIAGIIAAFVSYWKSKNDFISYLSEKRSIDLIKDLGHFWNTTEMKPFEQALIELLTKYENIQNIIRLHGGLVTEQRLRDDLQAIEQKLKEGIAKYEEVVRKQEGDLALMSGSVATLEKAIDEAKAKQERAQELVEIFHRISDRRI